MASNSRKIQGGTSIKNFQKNFVFSLASLNYTFFLILFHNCAYQTCYYSATTNILTTIQKFKSRLPAPKMSLCFQVSLILIFNYGNDEHSNKKCIQTFNCRKFKLFKNLTLCSFFLFLKNDAIPMQLAVKTAFALCRKWGLIMNILSIFIIFLTWYILDMMFSTIIGFPYKMAWPVTRYNPSQCSNGIGNKMNMWRIGTDKRKKIFSKIYWF